MRKAISFERAEQSANSGLHPGNTFATSLNIASFGVSDNFLTGTRLIPEVYVAGFTKAFDVFAG